MAYSPLTVANTFLDFAEEEGRRLTPLQLQKLVYLSHGWSLAIHHQDLIRYHVEAWKHGPVVPPLYYETRRYGADPVDPPIDVNRNPFLSNNDPVQIPERDGQNVNVCRFVWNTYGHLTGTQLSELTHKKGTPWYIVWHEEGGKDKLGAVIPNPLIQTHYESLLKRVEQAS